MSRTTKFIKPVRDIEKFLTDKMIEKYGSKEEALKQLKKSKSAYNKKKEDFDRTHGTDDWLRRGTSVPMTKTQAVEAKGKKASAKAGEKADTRKTKYSRKRADEETKKQRKASRKPGGYSRGGSVRDRLSRGGPVAKAN